MCVFSTLNVTYRVMQTEDAEVKGHMVHLRKPIIIIFFINAKSHTSHTHTSA